MAGIRMRLVEPGEYVLKIAAKLGCSEDEIWGIKQNDRVKKEGRTKDILYPRDQLYVPNLPPKPGTVKTTDQNAYQGAIPNVVVRLVFKLDGKPRAEKEYEILDAGAPICGKTDGDGMLSFEVPVNIPSVRVVFLDPGATYQVDIGHLHPVTTSSGVKQRLRQLGYLPLTPSAGGKDDYLTGALRRFQSDQGEADPKGDLDDATREKLKKAFGC